MGCNTTPALNMRILGVCSGNGVMLHPFLKSHTVVGNVEPRQIFYTPAQEQWKANFGNIPQRKSLEEIKCTDIDVIVGHPDCGSGSVLRLSRAKKNVSYKANPSLDTYFQAIWDCQPKYFLLENLPAFKKDFPESELKNLFPNYGFIYLEGSVAHFGNSQISRKRLIIIGVRGENRLKKAKKVFKLPKLKKKRLKTSEQFELRDKDYSYDIGHVRESPDKTCNLILGSRTKITYGEAKEEWIKRKGEARWKVGGKMNNQPGVTRNIAGKFPTTMRKQNRQFTTQGDVLSPREMANIQGVPEGFKLYMNPNKSVYWLNKARASVTKCAPYEISAYFLKKLNKLTKRT